MESLERSYRSPSDIPIKAHQVSSPTMPTCHGCHVSIGQGQHMGSAPRKLVCTLVHSPYCRGGISKDKSLKSCPQGIVMSMIKAWTTSDFHHPGTAQTCPTYSTPVTAYSMPGARVRVSDRLPSRFNGQELAAAPGGRLLDTVSAQHGGVEARVTIVQQVYGAAALQVGEGVNDQQGFHILP